MDVATSDDCPEESLNEVPETSETSRQESIPQTRTVRVLDDECYREQQTLLSYSVFPDVEVLDTVNLLQGDVPFVQFPNTNLNLAASYVIHYLRTRETHDWFHVMVKTVVFDAFVKALKGDPLTRTLAFSCWCDGGKEMSAKYRQHRHWTVVSPKGHFKKAVWAKVELPASKKKHIRGKFPCKRLKRVESALHLVNLIGYMSNTESRCRFIARGKKKQKRWEPKQQHHFYLYRTLPKTYKLSLVLLWDNGILDLLNQEKFQNISISQVVEGGMEWVNGQWRQQIKNFYGYETGWVVSICRNFVPIEDETSPYYLCLMNNKRLYFKECPEPLDEETWVNKQVNGGNCFYEAVGDEWWTPRPRDKKIMNVHMPVVKLNKKLKMEVNHLRKKNTYLCETLKQLKAKELIAK